MAGPDPYANLLATGFGLVGLLVIIASWQFQSPNTIRALNAASFLAFSIQLYYLNAISGAVMMLIALLFTITSIFTKRIGVLYLAAALTIAFALPVTEHFTDLLPPAANIFGYVAFFSRDVLIMRAFAPIGTILWGIYNSIHGAWPQVIADILILTSMYFGWLKSRQRIK